MERANGPVVRIFQPSLFGDDMDFEVLYWHWIVFGFALAIFEIFTFTFFALWFAAGALIVGALVYFFPALDLKWQLLIWAVVSSALAWAWVKYIKPQSKDRTSADLSREAILGQVGQVIRTPMGDKRGEMRFSVPILGSEEWDILCDDDIAIGDRVIVSDILGNALVVAKHNPNQGV